MLVAVRDAFLQNEDVTTLRGLLVEATLALLKSKRDVRRAMDSTRSNEGGGTDHFLMGCQAREAEEEAVRVSASAAFSDACSVVIYKVVHRLMGQGQAEWFSTNAGAGLIEDELARVNRETHSKATRHGYFTKTQLEQRGGQRFRR